jgi:hypothetical protein
MKVFKSKVLRNVFGSQERSNRRMEKMAGATS